MALKKYFQEPIVTEIRSKRFSKEINSDLADHILDLNNDEYLIIKSNLIPEEFYEEPRKFMKHGHVVQIPRYRTLENAIKIGKTPVQLREIAFNGIMNKVCSGYTFKPFIGTDKRTRKVSLTECLKGLKLYSYANKEGTSIDVKPYDDARKVESEGAEVIVEVPSRREKHDRHKFKFSSVPVSDNSFKWGVAYNVSTNHACESKTFKIKYGWADEKESSREFNFCAHEIAGYFAIIDYYLNKEKNLIPLQMSQFAIGTQLAVDYYNKLNKNCLIQTPDDKRPRRLIVREDEVLLWNLVKRLKHDKTFYSIKSRDGNARDYIW